ncbi:MAG: peptide deformylase, peptide deformylase [candidate division Kazan bacterium GW2011_GWA1_50_15]|uniref:Peptide deformylase n=2 Tax=Bacteria division Kazan-3B-28 TaxID=1798534 RepID=A0A0G2A4A9_UNCK3|nr:MAG: peptide deformylase, peptide deformylase [candidate division Kazan bacterium GW2011_GWA1_50_15]KKW25916.1 MAG: Peptide deformylase [candidate division Kazan bacterium GW2011_GWC1_52_13]KKW27069.1 MAG: Peptide deformylase [candidate division Kazan bacterium GW2011_GWB1_52_7]
MEGMKRKILLASVPKELTVLREVSTPVKKVDDKIRALVLDMFDSMRADNGIGLSAPQVGELKRIIITEYPHGKDQVPRTAIINPEIIWTSKKQVVDEEGCLSFPDLFGMVKRPEKIRYRGLDETGKPIEGKAGGLLARVIQHETDHLDGVLFIDQLEGDLYTYEKQDDTEKL